MVGGTCPKALIAASANGCMAVVELLLEHGAKVDCPAEISNGSALYRASGRGHEKIVGFLLDYGADPNFQSGHYGGPLQAASDSHFKGVVRLLLDKGARVNICRSGQRDALGIASTRGDEQIVRMLLEHGADTIDNALFWACSRGQESAVSILLERTAKIVTPNGPSFPKAIQAACWTDRANMIRPLLNHVAEVNLQEAFRDNALLEASRYACGEVLQLLLENGAKIKYHAPLEASQVMNGKTVIQHLPEYQQYREDAVGYGYTDKDYEVRVIDDIFSRAEIGDTQALIGNPLHMACLHGADPNAQGGFFGTALQAASYGGRKGIVRILLESGAEVTDYAIELASRDGHGAVLEMLKSARRSSTGITVPVLEVE